MNRCTWQSGSSRGVKNGAHGPGSFLWQLAQAITLSKGPVLTHPKSCGAIPSRFATPTFKMRDIDIYGDKHCAGSFPLSLVFIFYSFYF